MSGELLDCNDHGETEGLTPEAQALYRRLLNDGAAWRAESHSIQSLGAQLQRLASAMSTPPEAAECTRQAQAHTLDHILRSGSHSKGASSMPHGRIGGFAAVAATVAVVGALAVLLLTMAPGHRRPSSPFGSGAASDRHGVWVDLSQLDYKTSFSSNDVPAVAPSDPRVVYETLASGGGGVSGEPAQLRRTDDAGATWLTLPVPVPAANVTHAGMAVSPLKAHTVFLTLLDNAAADCPSGRAQPDTEAGSGVLCWLQFTSTDGGAHWASTHLPLAGGTLPGVLRGSVTVGGASPILSGALSAQGSRLYAGFMCVDFSCARLVTSTDGGLTWQFADQPLMASARAVCDYTNTSAGSAIFAVTTSTECSPNKQDPLTLWRSDDAGAHWAAVGNLATPNERGIKVVNDPRSGFPLLYMALPRTTSIATDKEGGKYPTFSAAPADVKVSADGGRTWTAAPSQGIPAGQAPLVDKGLSGVLPDGSVVVEFIPQANGYDFGGSTLYAWKQGDTTWRQLAPPITQELGSMLATPSGSGGLGAIWLVLVNHSSSSSHVQPPSPGDTFTFMRDCFSDT